MNEQNILESFKHSPLVINGIQQEIYLKKQVVLPPEAPRLIIVSYLPSEKTVELIKICIRSIKKYTNIPCEIWVVDNCSPVENLQELINEDNINLVLNRTMPSSDGSFANALALEVAVRLIDPNTHYIMTLHQDTAVIHENWLNYLFSKFNDKVRAVGVRLDTKRVPEGILHVLGYIVDFQLFCKMKLSFWPELPKYDVGDKVIIDLKRAGYEIFATPNSLWEPELVEKNLKDSPLYDLSVDRSFDDMGNVIFLHLGRGVLKSRDLYKQPNKLSSNDWRDFMEKYFI